MTETLTDTKKRIVNRFEKAITSRLHLYNYKGHTDEQTEKEYRRARAELLRIIEKGVIL